jgi:single-stranded DNA-binding protein
VLAEGRLETRTWTDKEGNVRKSGQIVPDGMQLGPKPGDKAIAPKSEQPALDLDMERTVRLDDDDEEGEGRHLTPAFNEDEEIDPADIPF